MDFAFPHHAVAKLRRAGAWTIGLLCALAVIPAVADEAWADNLHFNGRSYFFYHNGALVGTCTVPGTGGWQAWTTVSCAVPGATGTHDLYLRFAGGSGFLFNVNWWQFSPAASGARRTGRAVPL